MEHKAELYDVASYKKNLIDYIRLKDPSFAQENLHRLTETELVILKVSIELKVAKHMLFK
jgi:hypothetical protein